MIWDYCKMTDPLFADAEVFFIFFYLNFIDLIEILLFVFFV